LSVWRFAQTGRPPEVHRLWPAAQKETQVPPWQAWLPEHVVPQAPQLPLSVAVAAQYGEPPSTTQAVWPLAHAETQVPEAQTWVEPHAVPHAPQFARSSASFAQNGTPPSPPQVEKGAWQVDEQAPFEHTCPAAQRVPQAPQLAGSFLVSTHAPLHDVSDALHSWVQAPAEQICEALKSHVRPQAPQFESSLRGSTHAFPHSTSGALQRLHSPAWHEVPFPHTVPHAPQLLLSVFRSTQTSPQRSHGTGA
jgi:hypothetical protein